MTNDDLKYLLHLLGEIACYIAADDIAGAELKAGFLVDRLADAVKE